MLKSVLFFFLLSFSFLSCSKSDQQQIMFPNDVSFNLEKGEYLEKENSIHIVNHYFDFFQNQENRVPLYKTVRHSDYSIYIGMPYGVDLESIKNKKLLAVKGQLIIDEEDCKDCVYSVSSLNEQLIVRYVLDINSNLIMCLGVTKNKDLISEKGFLSVNALSKRIFK